MSVINKVAAAIVAGGALFGASAMAQEQAATPEQQTLTAEEGVSLRHYFAFKSCVDKRMEGLQIAVMFGQMTQEQAQTQFNAATTECGTKTGLSVDQANATVEGLITKYGENNIQQVIANSQHVIYVPATELTADEAATINLLHDFQACTQAEVAAYATTDEAWHAAADAGLEKGQTEEQILAEIGQHPEEPDVVAVCGQKLGIADTQALEGQLEDLANKYGETILRQRPATPAP